LVEVLNFAKQNPPLLAQAAGKKRNPTLQRIKRILGYPAQNYPQTPIISIPMLFTLVLSLGLMASAQQVAPKPLMKLQISPLTKLMDPVLPLTDTSSTVSFIGTDGNEFFFSEKNEMVISDGKNTYRISGDTLFTENGHIILTGKIKLALEDLIYGNVEGMPEIDFPEAPEFQDEWFVPIPDYDLDIPLPPDPLDPPFDSFEFEDLSSWDFSFADTSKMSKQEREKWRKEIESIAKEGVNQAEMMSREMELKSRELEKKWRENESVRREKMAEWEATFQQEFQPKLKEFELKMQEWQKANEPKMKEFELKMKAWKEAQEPKLKEFELKMKEWEAIQKPKMEEFQCKMEAWQKEHQAKLQEFQKLLQEELKKENN